MTIAAAEQFDTDADASGVCWDCGGPCLTYKGTEHGWRCRGCIDRYLDEGAAKAEARDRKEQERLARKAFHNSNPTIVTLGSDRRRDGGGPRYVPRPVPASVIN